MPLYIARLQKKKKNLPENCSSRFKNIFFPLRKQEENAIWRRVSSVAARRGGIQNVPIVSVGASDPLLIPRSAKHRADPLVPTLATLSFSPSLLSPTFLLLFLSLAAARFSFVSLPPSRFLVFDHPLCAHPPCSLALLHGYARYTARSQQCPTPTSPTLVSPCSSCQPTNWPTSLGENNFNSVTKTV